MRLSSFLGLKTGRGDDRDFLLERLPKGSVCAEIGVWKGDFSQKILETAQPSALHLIDPWVFVSSFPKRLYGGKSAKSQSDMDAIYQAVRAKFSEIPQVHIHRQRSHDAVSSFADGFFDWVYIDGDHSYEAVRQDLNLWTPKVKRGGFVAGDDYGWHDEKGERSVQRAVDEFVAGRNLADVTIKDDQFIIKV
jgi:Methyltransferase domain